MKRTLSSEWLDKCTISYFLIGVTINVGAERAVPCLASQSEQCICFPHKSIASKLQVRLYRTKSIDFEHQIFEDLNFVNPVKGAETLARKRPT